MSIQHLTHYSQYHPEKPSIARCIVLIHQHEVYYDFHLRCLPRGFGARLARPRANCTPFQEDPGNRLGGCGL